MRKKTSIEAICLRTYKKGRSFYVMLMIGNLFSTFLNLNSLTFKFHLSNLIVFLLMFVVFFFIDWSRFSKKY